MPSRVLPYQALNSINDRRQKKFEVFNKDDNLRILAIIAVDLKISFGLAWQIVRASEALKQLFDLLFEKFKYRKLFILATVVFVSTHRVDIVSSDGVILRHRHLLALLDRS